MGIKVEVGPRLELLLHDLEQRISAAALEAEDDLDEEEKIDIEGEVRWGSLDLDDLPLIAELIADTPDLLLLRFPYDEDAEEDSLHTIADYVIKNWLIEELERRMLSPEP